MEVLTDIDVVTKHVIGIAMRVHQSLGPGLFEKVYETVLAAKIEEMGYKVDRQVAVDIEFEGISHPAAFKIDLLVDDRLILEIKSVDQPHPAHAKQLLTHLRLAKLQVGLVLNFGGETLKEGVRRVVNNHSDSAISPSSAPLREPKSDSIF